MIGAEICKALGLEGERVSKLEMTFTASEAKVVVTLPHLDIDRPAGARLVETMRAFELVERSAPSAPAPVAPGVVISCPNGEAYRVVSLAERVQWVQAIDAKASPAKLGVSDAPSDCPDALRDVMRANSAALESDGVDNLGLA